MIWQINSSIKSEPEKEMNIEAETYHKNKKNHNRTAPIINIITLLKQIKILNFHLITINKMSNQTIIHQLYPLIRTN